MESLRRLPKIVSSLRPGDIVAGRGIMAADEPPSSSKRDSHSVSSDMILAAMGWMVCIVHCYLGDGILGSCCDEPGDEDEAVMVNK